MLAQTTTGTIQGVVAHPVTVEANSGEKGEPKCVLVGLPDVAVRESMDRVFSSISNAGYSRPRTRVTINLAPADLRKEGASFDLPIALALLSSIGQFSSEGLNNYFIAGELALSGEVRYVKGALAMAILAEKMGKGIILPKSSANEACLVKGIKVFRLKVLPRQFLSLRKILIQLLLVLRKALTFLLPKILIHSTLERLKGRLA